MPVSLRASVLKMAGSERIRILKSDATVVFACGAEAPIGKDKLHYSIGNTKQQGFTLHVRTARSQHSSPDLL